MLDWRFNPDGITIEVERLDHSDYSPCAQALIEMGALVRFDRFGVRLPAHEHLAMVASRKTLDASLPLWFHTQRRRRKMPPALFIPILFESRLLVETPIAAAEAVLWLALNEGVHFIEDLHERHVRGVPISKSIAALADDLQLAASSLETCSLLAPEQIPLWEPAHRALLTASTFANLARQGGVAGVSAMRGLEQKADEIEARWADLAPCAVLPTVDPTPLSPR